MSEKDMTPFEKSTKLFAASSNLAAATEVVWNRTIYGADTGRTGMFQHYTTLSRVLEKIVTRRWWLTRGDSPKLNDLLEAVKYGCSNDTLMRQSYILCLGNGAGESVAMWGLYARNDPLAMRVSLPYVTVQKWMGDLVIGNNLDVQDKNGHDIKASEIMEILFRDVVYVAVQDKDVLDEFDIRRTNVISWEGSKCTPVNRSDLKREIRNPKYAAWLKDYEWQHERESRLCIRLKEELKDDAISVAIPDYVIADMRLTFSPWLEDESVRKSIQATIEAALKSIGVKWGKRPQHFRRSVLKGALNLKS